MGLENEKYLASETQQNLGIQTIQPKSLFKWPRFWKKYYNA